ncbi:YrzE family protein [Arthrobacter gengyunqii]|uniref:YrzE family protein n=1 Tax=Arthrobacter gengyunqii TaxID=2886940 RepID=A0A9X1LZT9_9MICC|nr:YrzE family protein [Arthrobacter gengyunqii]MCC3268659.1 YrzE family protein [Arthrobacter gengyunqii]UOY96046.1 YrzE family protein [Arthrobacter gengyunqii]
MSTEPGNNGRAGADGSGDFGNSTGPDGGRLRDRSDRMASADETQVLPTGNGSDAPTSPATGATGATAAGTSATGTSADTSANSTDDGGRTRAMPLSHTKDPNADYDDDSDYRPEDNRRHTGNDAGNTGTARTADAGVGLPGKANREALLAMEKERFGGMKFGAAFFGWLTATGMVVLLSALAAAIGAAVDFNTDNDLGQSLDQAMANQSAGIIGTIILLLVLLLAYFAGGYVAGRMARFNGLKQGLAVWLWALIAGVIVVVLGLIFGDDIRSITQLNTVAPLPEDLDGATAAAWIGVAATLAATLIGALLGGLAGMRYHRRIDRADYSDTDVRA